MNIAEILKNVGKGLLKNAFPPISGIVFDTINASLSDSKQLGENSTGEEAEEAIRDLPPEQRASLLEKKFEFEITKVKEFTKVQEILAKADIAGASFRPWIAVAMAAIVVYADLVAITAWAFTVYKNPEILASTWPLIVAILATPTALLRAYYAMRTKEKVERYSAITNQAPKIGWATQLITTFKS